MEIQLREVLSLTRRMSEIIAHHTGRPVEQVAQDIDRDHYMTAGEARDYGIIDDIILPAPRPVRAGARLEVGAAPTTAWRRGEPDAAGPAPGSAVDRVAAGAAPCRPWTGPRRRRRSARPARPAHKVGDTAVRDLLRSTAEAALVGARAASGTEGRRGGPNAHRGPDPGQRGRPRH